MKCLICNTKLENTDINTNKSFPFCSFRCKNIDLYCWLSGEYEENLEELPLKFVEIKGEN